MGHKHTPGPWEVFICDDGKQWTGWPLSINAVNLTDKTVVRTGGQWPYEWDANMSQVEAVANARLIAAAPDLLEALETLIERIEEGASPSYAIEVAKAVIAKATGDA